MKTKIESLPVFAPDMKSPAEILSLGGISRLLRYYEYLIDQVTSKAVDADKERKTCATDLRAALPFLFKAASFHTRKEFASGYDTVAPISERKGIADHATAVVDAALAALKKYDADETFRTVF